MCERDLGLVADGRGEWFGCGMMRDGGHVKLGYDVGFGGRGADVSQRVIGFGWRVGVA